MVCKAPEAFTRRLRREFPSLRTRWSIQKGAWAIEQRVGRGSLSPFRTSERDDSLIRARDGYWLVCYVQPGDRMACPTCGDGPIKVPILHFREVRCNNCYRRGRDGRVMAGYFPLGEALLEHLRETDPRRGAIEKMAEKADEANQKMLEQQQRNLHNSIEAATLDDFRRMVGIQSVGWTPAMR